jgi:uncharacterized phage protein (TIGR01671 family)
MREIKFRAWHAHYKEMVYFDNARVKKDQYQAAYLGALMDGDYGSVLMQYTGLKDKNGVEVYEGDVVKVWNEDYPEEFQIGKVWWFSCYCPAFDIYTPNKKTGTGFESYSDEFNSFTCPEYCFEVIGNIHQHPELIEA